MSKAYPRVARCFYYCSETENPDWAIRTMGRMPTYGVYLLVEVTARVWTLFGRRWRITYDEIFIDYRKSKQGAEALVDRLNEHRNKLHIKAGGDDE